MKEMKGTCFRCMHGENHTDAKWLTIWGSSNAIESKNRAIHFRRVLASEPESFIIVGHLPYCLAYIRAQRRCFIAASWGTRSSSTSLFQWAKTIPGAQPKRARKALSWAVGARYLNGSFYMKRPLYSMSSTVGSAALARFFSAMVRE